MNSNLYSSLITRRNDLEILFLNFPTSDSLLSQNQDKIKAFIILFHSELEYYFELIGKGVNSFQKASAVASRNYSSIPNHYFVFGIKQPDFSVEFDQNIRGEKILKEYETLLAKKNNGIKSKDILSILLPLGIDYSHIGLTLLNTLNDYGEKRCKFAHTGISLHASQALDRNIESQMSNTIISMIHNLDEYILLQNVGISI